MQQRNERRAIGVQCLSEQGCVIIEFSLARHHADGTKNMQRLLAQQTATLIDECCVLVMMQHIAGNHMSLGMGAEGEVLTNDGKVIGVSSHKDDFLLRLGNGKSKRARKGRACT